MKSKITTLLFLCTILLSCSKDSDLFIEDSPTADRIIIIDGQTTQDPVILSQTDLMAGQNILMGFVTVGLDENGLLEVTYNSDGDWEIEETHLFIGELSDLPTNNGGNPKIGQFPYKSNHPAGTNTVTYEIGTTLAEGACVYVAAHAVVTDTSNGQTETAWGAGVPIGGNSWAMMFEVCN